jgi:general secretion pathway protein F
MWFEVKLLNESLVVEARMIDAATEAEVRELIAQGAGQILEVRAARKLGWPAGRHDFRLAIFNQQLHSLLEAGQTVVEAIDILSRNDGRGRNQLIYQTLLSGLRQGRQLSDAMAGLPSVFPKLFVAMVRSSEKTGSIRQAIERYINYQRQVDEITQKLRAAATYPAVLLGVGALVIAFLMLYVLPRFSAVYEDAGSMRRGSAEFVQWWGGFVRNNEILAWTAVLFVLGAAMVPLFHPAARRAAYRWLLNLPWLGERTHVFQLARLYRTLGMLLQCGVSVLAAMRMTQDSLPEAMHPGLQQAIRQVGEGIALSTAMREAGLSTEVAVRLLIAGEGSGNLSEMMGRTADFYDKETAIWIDTAGRLIEPALMLGIGLVVGAIVLMLYSPIFDLANVV